MMTFHTHRFLCFLPLLFQGILISCSTAHQNKSPEIIMASNFAPPPGHTLAYSQHLANINTHFDEITSIVLSDRFAVTAGSDFTLRTWNLQKNGSNHLLTTLPQSTTSMALDRLGEFLVVGMADGSVELWNIKESSLVHRFIGLKRGVTATAINIDLKIVAASDFSGLTLLWDIENKSLLYSSNLQTGAINQLDFSPDNKFFAAASDDKSIKIWRINSPSRIQPLLDFNQHDGWVTSLAFSPDSSKIATFSADHFIRIWDLHKKMMVGKYFAHRSSNATIQFLTKSSILIAGSQIGRHMKGPQLNDFSLMILDLKTGKIDNYPHTHNGPIIAIHSLEKNRFITASLDETIMQWTIPSPAHITTQ